MSSIKIEKKLKRYCVGELPLIHAAINRLKLREILYNFIPKKNGGVPVVETLILLIYNLTIGKEPLYELPAWINTIDFRAIGLERYEGVTFTDDRFGKALDKLYQIDRSTLMTEIVMTAIKTFNIDLNQLHNDSTTIKACGKYPEKTNTRLQLKRGKSKDHRPDLKQLVFSLSISADGAVPIHYKTYPGNQNDDTTHIETWNMLRKIHNGPDFLYVADCKLCSESNLRYIAEEGGKVITVIPNSWKEVQNFKETLRKNNIRKKEILRRKSTDGDVNYFSFFQGDYFTKQGYRIHWIFSSEMQRWDRSYRETQLKKTEKELRDLELKLNKRKLKTEEQIHKAYVAILTNRKTTKFVDISLEKTIEKNGSSAK